MSPASFKPEGKLLSSKEQSIASLAPLEAFFLDSGVLTLSQLRLLQERAQSMGHALGEEMVACGLISSALLATVQAQALGIEPVCMEEWVLDPLLNEKIPLNLRRRGVALLREGEAALAYPEDLALQDQIQKYVPLTRIFSASLPAIQEALLKCFGSSLEEYMAGLEDHPQEIDIAALVDQVLLESLKKGASDIHFQPEESWIRLQLRMDGELGTIRIFSKRGWERVLARLKVMAQVDLAQRLKPQSGRFSRHILGREVDFRLSLHPTMWGENCVIRILDKEQGIRNLEDLGFGEEVYKELEFFLNNPQGLFIVTGPTGSGKTTTLYAMLKRLARPGVNIMTLEDPIEYIFHSIRQTEVGVHLSYAEGIRSILRQDPDVLLVGEVRDEETAQMAFRAALTGHGVLTTLHAGSPLGVIDRLKDLRVPISQMSGFLTGILSQRLRRIPCSICLGEGCESCHYTGKKGRCAEGEMIRMTSNLQKNLDRSLPELEELWEEEKKGTKGTQE